jgi:hypothetical protein
MISAFPTCAYVVVLGLLVCFLLFAGYITDVMLLLSWQEQVPKYITNTATLLVLHLLFLPVYYVVICLPWEHCFPVIFLYAWLKVTDFQQKCQPVSLTVSFQMDSGLCHVTWLGLHIHSKCDTDRNSASVQGFALSLLLHSEPWELVRLETRLAC